MNFKSLQIGSLFLLFQLFLFHLSKLNQFLLPIIPNKTIKLLFIRSSWQSRYPHLLSLLNLERRQLPSLPVWLLESSLLLLKGESFCVEQGLSVVGEVLATSDSVYLVEVVLVD